MSRISSKRAEVAFWSLWLSAVATFVALAVWADHRYALPLDRRVTFGVQELYRYGWADRFFQTVNDLGGEGAIILALFAAFAFALLRGLRYEALTIAGTGAVRYVQLGVRALVHRPDAYFNAMRANFDGLQRPMFYPNPNAFPSGHVFGVALVYGLIFAYVPRAIRLKPLAWLVRAFCFFEIALIGPARMYAGAHWFSDVGRRCAPRRHLPSARLEGRRPGHPPPGCRTRAGPRVRCWSEYATAPQAPLARTPRPGESAADRKAREAEPAARA